MSDLIGSLSSAYGASGSSYSGVSSSSSSSSLDMDDFLVLMVKMFQNQDIENTASTTEMMNQLVQMSVMQAVTNVTDATTMLYASSLVGKEVTLGQYDSSGNLQETVGTVTGTGTYSGQQVVFVDGKSYYLSEIMAVGRLPDVEEDSGTSAEDGAESDKTA